MSRINNNYIRRIYINNAWQSRCDAAVNYIEKMGVIDDVKYSDFMSRSTSVQYLTCVQMIRNSTYREKLVEYLHRLETCIAVDLLTKIISGER